MHAIKHRSLDARVSECTGQAAPRDSRRIIDEAYPLLNTWTFCLSCMGYRVSNRRIRAPLPFKHLSFRFEHPAAAGA